MGAIRVSNKRGEGTLLRAEILQAATRLLTDAAARDAVTLRAIAREAGIAAPSIYKHFADRNAILDALVDDTFQELARICQNAAASARPGIDQVRAISHAYVEFAAGRRSQYRILFERSRGDLVSPAHAYPSGLRAFTTLSDAVASAAPPPDHQTTIAAQALWAALHGLVTLIPATPGFPWASVSDLVDQLVNQLSGPDAARCVLGTAPPE